MLIVAGPTGSGKSDFAVELAVKKGAEIVCADAFQLYAGMEHLTAAPDPVLLERVPHHLYAVVPVEEPCDASRYLALLGPVLADIRARGRVPMLVGGTGLYIKAAVEGISEGIPAPDPALRARLDATPLADLLTQLLALDPVSHDRIDRRNPRRVIRALEICLLSGRPCSELRTRHQAPPVAWHGWWLHRRPADLQERIRERTARLVRGPAPGEVAAVRDRAGPTARQAIGFRDICTLLDGCASLSETEKSIALATRRYAKRQRTWFRNQTPLQELPLPPSFPQNALGGQGEKDTSPGTSRQFRNISVLDLPAATGTIPP